MGGGVHAVKHHLHRTTAYHPESNGMVERVHRRLKDALRARAAGPNWVADLPWILLGLWAQPREDTGPSAAEAVFGAPLVLPGQFLHQPEPPGQEFLDQLRQAMSNFQPAPVRHNTGERSAAPAELPPALGAIAKSRVLVRLEIVGA